MNTNRNRRGRTAGAVALFGALQATHHALHPLCDQVLQGTRDAVDKTLQEPHELALAWRACARHVAVYSTAQVLGAVGVSRALGVRLPWRAVAAGTALNAVTHFVIDRREPLRRLMDLTRRGPYLEYATTVRKPGGEADDTGPGTALFECDQAVHKAISVAATLLTVVVANRTAGRR